MSASAHWLTDVIKGELGFDGFLMTDVDGVLQLGPDIHEDLLTAIGAGIDLVNVRRRTRRSSATIDGARRVGHDPESAHRRRGHAHPAREGHRRSLRRAAARRARSRRVGSAGAPRARATGGARVARPAEERRGAPAAAEERARPRRRARRDDLGVQSGGWTLGWQGVTGVPSAAMGGGTTILAALRATASVAGPRHVLARRHGRGGHRRRRRRPLRAPVRRVPRRHARFHASTTRRRRNVYDGTAAALVRNMRRGEGPARARSCVTGRPVRIESYLPDVRRRRRRVAAGLGGEGVADVLYGDAPFTGVLSKSWPRDATALPITRDQTPVRSALRVRLRPDVLATARPARAIIASSRSTAFSSTVIAGPNEKRTYAEARRAPVAALARVHVEELAGHDDDLLLERGAEEAHAVVERRRQLATLPQT